MIITRSWSESKIALDEMALIFVISLLFLSAVVAKPLSQTPPQWSNAYTVSGVLSLPYAEIVEPMEVWFDGENGRSRIDYYSGETSRGRKRRQVIVFLFCILYILYYDVLGSKVCPVCSQMRVNSSLQVHCLGRATKYYFFVSKFKFRL